MKEDEESRGVKRAGSKFAEAREAEVQKIREAGVLLVSYLSEGDIPDSPSEPFLEELVTSQQAVPPPKVIPLPQELRAQTVLSHCIEGLLINSVAPRCPPISL